MFADDLACLWWLVMGGGHVMWLPWLRGGWDVVWLLMASWPTGVQPLEWWLWRGDCRWGSSSSSFCLRPHRSSSESALLAKYEHTHNQICIYTRGFIWGNSIYTHTYVELFDPQMSQLWYSLLLELVSCSDRKCCDSQCVWVVRLTFSSYTGLNHHIGSSLNYRLLCLSQLHRAIFEACVVLKCDFFFLLFFLSQQMCCDAPSQYPFGSIVLSL